MLFLLVAPLSVFAADDAGGQCSGRSTWKTETFCWGSNNNSDYACWCGGEGYSIVAKVKKPSDCDKYKSKYDDCYAEEVPGGFKEDEQAEFAKFCNKLTGGNVVTGSYDQPLPTCPYPDCMLTCTRKEVVYDNGSINCCHGEKDYECVPRPKRTTTRPRTLTGYGTQSDIVVGDESTEEYIYLEDLVGE